MRRFWCSSILVVLSVSVLAQRHTYDIVEHIVPEGWQTENRNDFVVYSTIDQERGSWCQIAIYKSVSSKGSVETDFESEWNYIVRSSNELTSGPDEPQLKQVNGWNVVTASGNAVFNNAPMIIRHTVASGHGVCVSITARTNNERYLKIINDFLHQVEYRVITNQQPVSASQQGAPKIDGTWIKSSGVQVTWADPVSAGTGGYTKSQYNFTKDGNYTFIAKTFQYSYNKLILVKEEGKYVLDGNKLTITPQSSVVEAWSKKDGTDKWGNLLSSQKRKLESTTYTVTHHFFEGIKEWNLVLQSNSPTERDGAFSGNTTFANAYYYAMASGSNTPIDLP